MPSTFWRAYFPAVTKEKYLEVRPSSSVFITTQKLGGKSKEFIKKKKRWQIWAHTCMQIKYENADTTRKSALPLGPLGLDKN